MCTVEPVGFYSIRKFGEITKMDFGVVLGTWNQVWQFGSVGLGFGIFF